MSGEPGGSALTVQWDWKDPPRDDWLSRNPAVVLRTPVLLPVEALAVNARVLLSNFYDDSIINIYYKGFL